MIAPSAAEVRALVASHVASSLAAKRLEPDDLLDSFDLLVEGVIDSFGIVELILKIEQSFGFEVDFADLEIDDLTRIGPLSRYVEERGRLAGVEGR